MNSLEVALARIEALREECKPTDYQEVMFAKVTGMAHGYHLAHEPSHRYKVREMEVELDAPLVNFDSERMAKSQVWRMAGKVDKIVEEKTTGQLDIVDHKTASLSPYSDTYRRQLATDTQAKQYAMLCLLNGHRVIGAVWDIARKPTIRLKKGETIESYTQRCIDYCCENYEDNYARVSNTYTRAELADYAKEIYKDARMMRGMQLSRHHPQNPMACWDYNRPCEYFPLCHENGDIERDFVQLEKTHTELSWGINKAVKPKHQLFTYSRHKCWRQCARKHHYKYNWRLQPINWAEEEPLVLGTMWHEVMDAWWYTQSYILDTEDVRRDQRSTTGLQEATPIRTDDEA